MATGLDGGNDSSRAIAGSYEPERDLQNRELIRAKGCYLPALVLISSAVQPNPRSSVPRLAAACHGGTNAVSAICTRTRWESRDFLMARVACAGPARTEVFWLVTDAVHYHGCWVL